VNQVCQSGGHPVRKREMLLPSAVRVGGMDKRELFQALCRHNVHFNQAAEALFDDPRFTPLAQGKVIEIAAISVSGLGFEEGATYEQLTARALESGLVECPLELAPHLRMPGNLWSPGDVFVFSRGESLKLRAYREQQP